MYALGATLYHMTTGVLPFGKLTPEEALRYSAVQLFLQGARRVRSDFKLGAEDVAPVGRICRLVHGMPLGLLLAAAWVEMLSPNEIAAEIDRLVLAAINTDEPVEDLLARARLG